MQVDDDVVGTSDPEEVQEELVLDVPRSELAGDEYPQSGGGERSVDRGGGGDVGIDAGGEGVVGIAPDEGAATVDQERPPVHEDVREGGAMEVAMDGDKVAPSISLEQVYDEGSVPPSPPFFRSVSDGTSAVVRPPSVGDVGGNGDRDDVDKERPSFSTAAVGQPDQDDGLVAPSSSLPIRVVEEQSASHLSRLPDLLDEELAASRSSAPKRSLRQRTAQQLNPYTSERSYYRRMLLRNDWQDAIVRDATLRELERLEREQALDDMRRRQSGSNAPSPTRTPESPRPDPPRPRRKRIRIASSEESSSASEESSPLSEVAFSSSEESFPSSEASESDQSEDPVNPVRRRRPTRISASVSRPSTREQRLRAGKRKLVGTISLVDDEEEQAQQVSPSPPMSPPTFRSAEIRTPTRRERKSLAASRPPRRKHDSHSRQRRLVELVNLLHGEEEQAGHPSPRAFSNRDRSLNDRSLTGHPPQARRQGPHRTYGSASRQSSPDRGPEHGRGRSFEPNGFLHEVSEPEQGPSVPQSLHGEDHDTFSSIRKFSPDFGVRPLPSGIRFHSDSYIGKGRLYDLVSVLHGHSRSDTLSPRSGHAFDLYLDPSAKPEELQGNLPIIFDGIFATLEAIASIGQEPGIFAKATDEVMRFLHTYISTTLMHAGSAAVKVFASFFQGQLDHLFQRLADLELRSSEVSGRVFEPKLWLLWFAIEASLRLQRARSQRVTETQVEDAFVSFEEEAVGVFIRRLMISLLSHGLHRTVRSLRRVKEAADDRPALLTDVTAELWVCLIHVLAHPSDSSPYADFWQEFGNAADEWLRSSPPKLALQVNETLWYACFALCALSQFSAVGMSTSSYNLPSCWSMVHRALTHNITLRQPVHVERSVSSTALKHRDAYIRAVLLRCLNLATAWQWCLGENDVITTLFEVFNLSKLSDLPTETVHDFPPFLQSLDLRLLSESGSPADSAFQLFLKLVFRAGTTIRQAAPNETEGIKRLKRFFSRVAPIRTLPFSKSSPPTARERSQLLNHYSIVMIFLHLVPESYNLRLRQLRGFLDFADADHSSRLTCIRGMMYAAILVRHHHLPLEDVVAWLAETAQALMAELEALEASKNGTVVPDIMKLSTEEVARRGWITEREALGRPRQVKLAKESIRMILRAVQHIVRTPSLDPSDEGSAAEYPDVLLLHPAWIKAVLDSSLGLEIEISSEVLDCLRTFLACRNRAISSLTPAQANRESQDEFGAFDVDLDDPALNQLLGQDGDHVGKGASLRDKDRKLAEVIRESISPAIYHLVSNLFAPDFEKGRPVRSDPSTSERDRRRREMERRLYVDGLIDCWAGCAHVMVQNEMRDWSAYLNAYGAESWRRISDPVGRRDVGLLFMRRVAALDPQAYWSFKEQFLDVWMQTLVARRWTLQSDFTTQLIALDPEEPLFAGLPSRGATEPGPLALDEGRLDLLKVIFVSMRQELESHGASTHVDGGARFKRKAAMYGCLSSLLLGMRDYLHSIPVSDPTRPDYLSFCLSVILALREALGELANERNVRELAYWAAVEQAERGKQARSTTPASPAAASALSRHVHRDEDMTVGPLLQQRASPLSPSFQAPGSTPSARI